IHYIWSPTVHTTWKCNYFCKIQTAKYLFSSAVRAVLALVKACRRSFHFSLGGCRISDLCLESADWPCDDHMHSSIKITSLTICTKLSMCRMSPKEIRGGGAVEEGEDQSQDQMAFLHNAED
ncbi:unnamed protein product, partial [Staurois parvus]